MSVIDRAEGAARRVGALERALLIAAGWFGAAAAAWRPLPRHPGRAARWMLLAGGLG